MIEFLEPQGENNYPPPEMTKGVNWAAVAYVSVVWLLLLLTLA